MKTILSLASAIALLLPSPVMAEGLRSDIYKLGSGWVQVAIEGDRVCFEGSSNRGQTIASMSRRYPSSDSFEVAGMDAEIEQINPRRILWGRSPNRVELHKDFEAALDISQNMRDCLNSRGRFVRRSRAVQSPRMLDLY